jgi:hypothetical protein
MHADLRNAVIASVRRRVEQGDCPTEPAHTVETLENVILDLAPKVASEDQAARDRRMYEQGRRDERAGEPEAFV